MMFLVRCAIWCHLYILKNVKSTHGGGLRLPKVTLNCTNGTKSHSVSQLEAL